MDEFVEVKASTLLVGVGDEMGPRKTMRAEVAEGTTRVRATFMGPCTITYVHANQAPRRPNFPYGY